MNFPCTSQHVPIRGKNGVEETPLTLSYVGGKGGLSLGQQGGKRHRKISRGNIQGVTKPSIRRLARRGGVKRISLPVYDETREALKTFLEKVISDAVLYTDHAGRKTVTSLDVIHALKKRGREFPSARSERIENRYLLSRLRRFVWVCLIGIPRYCTFFLKIFYFSDGGK